MENGGEDQARCPGRGHRAGHFRQHDRVERRVQRSAQRRAPGALSRIRRSAGRGRGLSRGRGHRHGVVSRGRRRCPAGDFKDGQHDRAHQTGRFESLVVEV